MRRTAIAVAALALLTSLPGCRCARGGAREARMAELGAALVQLSAAVEGVVRYGELAPDAGQEEILAEATRDQPALLAPFEGYALRVERRGGHAVVLVCEARGGAALLEDVGCSSELDRAPWAAPDPALCAATLDPVQACPAVGRTQP